MSSAASSPCSDQGAHSIPGENRRRARQRAAPHLRRLLEDLATEPAIFLGRRTDILAWNHLAAALIADFEQIPEKHRNYIRLLFTDPAMRSLHPDWENIARLRGFLPQTLEA